MSGLIRSGEKTRIGHDFPTEIRPLTEEINQLLAHSEAQAGGSRRHAGNLAHALKTPLTVITNAATAKAPDLSDTRLPRGVRDAAAGRPPPCPRARHSGRRASVQARATVWESLEAVQRAVDRLYENVTVDIAGSHDAQVRVERQDLDEMLGNLVENAAKYGGGRVFVTVEPNDRTVDILIEDDGPGSRKGTGSHLPARCAARHKPGTGLGLAIVRDVAEIYAAGSRWKARTWAACSHGSRFRRADYSAAAAVCASQICQSMDSNLFAVKGFSRSRRLRAGR